MTLWNAQTDSRKPYFRLPVSHGIKCLAISRDDRYLATSGFKNTIQLWNLKDGGELFETERTIPTVCLQFGSSGSWFAAAGEHGIVIIWEIQDSRLRQINFVGSPGVNMLHGGLVQLAASADDSHLFGMYRNNIVIVWNIKEDLNPKVFEITLHSCVSSVWDKGLDVFAFRLLVVTDDRKAVRIFNTVNGEVIGNIPTSEAVMDACFSKCGRHVIIWHKEETSNNVVINVWEVTGRTGESLYTVTHPMEEGETFEAVHSSFSGKYLLSVSTRLRMSAGLRLWSIDMPGMYCKIYLETHSSRAWRSNI